jgi:hypothetical protein
MKRVTLLVALLLLTAPILIQTALAQSPDTPVSSGSITSLQAANVEAYWTEERMRNAKPLPLPAISGSAKALGAVAGPAGPPLVASSGRPGATPVELTGAQAEGLASGQDPLFGTFPDSYTRFRLFPNLASIYTTFPHRMVGKLFFSRGGVNFVCSGATVNSTNRAVVWTAGHCVFTPGFGFHTNFAFVPARFQGAAPLGIWTVRTAFTLNGWSVLNRFNYDHGALVMNRRNGALIGNVIGFLGFAANLSRGQHWHAQGYPSAPRNLAQTPPGAQFDGEHQELCAATFARNDQPGAASDPPTIGIGCDKTGGTSGGPWTKDFSGVGGLTNILNGNNSYRYLGGPPNNLRLFSPYFTTGAINLRNAAQAVVVSN